MNYDPKGSRYPYFRLLAPKPCLEWISEPASIDREPKLQDMVNDLKAQEHTTYEPWSNFDVCALHGSWSSMSLSGEGGGGVWPTAHTQRIQVAPHTCIYIYIYISHKYIHTYLMYA